MAIDGKLIKLARETRGRSQAELADLIEKDQTYISKLEKNKLVGGIKGDELLAIAKYLNLSPLVFSGDLTLEDGNLENEATIRGIIKRMDSVENTVNSKLPSINKHDPICERVMKNPSLYSLLTKIQFWDSEMVQRLEDMATGLAAGKAIVLAKRERKNA